MEMLRSLRGDKHEFCLTVIKFNIKFKDVVSLATVSFEDAAGN